MNADEGNCVDVQGDVLFVCKRECVCIILRVFIGVCSAHSILVLLNSKC